MRRLYIMVKNEDVLEKAEKGLPYCLMKGLGSVFIEGMGRSMLECQYIDSYTFFLT